MLETTHAEPEAPVRMNLRVLFSLANFLYTDERINYTVFISSQKCDSKQWNE